MRSPGYRSVSARVLQSVPMRAARPIGVIKGFDDFSLTFNLCLAGVPRWPSGRTWARSTSGAGGGARPAVAPSWPPSAFLFSKRRFFLCPHVQRIRFLPDLGDENARHSILCECRWRVCIAERFFVHCLLPVAGHSRHRFRMVESTLDYWDPASADWRIRSTSFEPRQQALTWLGLARGDGSGVHELNNPGWPRRPA